MKDKEPKYKDKEWLERKYIEEDLTDCEIAKVCKVSESTIGNWRKQFDINQPKPKYKSKEWLTRKYVKEKLTIREIANICNVGKDTITRWKQRLNIKRPSPRYQNEKWLKEQYVNKQLSDYEIAKKIGVHRSTIQNWRQCLDISSRNLGDAISLSRTDKLTITPNLIKFLDGTLLGDGCLQNSNGYSVRYLLTQKHRSYCKWISKKLRGFGIKQSGKIYRFRQSTKEIARNFSNRYIPNKERIITSYHYITLSYRSLKEQYKRWYPNGKKQVPRDLILTPNNVLSWFLEDGTFLTHENYTIGTVGLATNGFNYEEVQFLANLLRAKLKTDSINIRKNKKNFIIAFGLASVVDSFFNYLAPLPQELYEDYSYKFPKAYL